MTAGGKRANVLHYSDISAALHGRATEGPLAGEELELIPSIITHWRTRKRDHPRTTVLNMSRTAQRFRHEVFRRPEQFVLGMTDGPARAWKTLHPNTSIWRAP